jgi:hypothetical protein
LFLRLLVRRPDRYPAGEVTMLRLRVSIHVILICGFLLPLRAGATESWWAGFAPGQAGVNAQVLCLATYSGSLVAGGDFTSCGTTPAGRVAAWNGSAWTPLGAGFDAAPSALTVHQGKLYAGGWFLQADHQPAAYLASWDGNAWSAVGGGVDNYVRALCVYQGNLVVGGAFTHAGGVAIAYVARWDGSAWSALGTLSGRVEDLAVFDGKLYATGMFDQADGASVQHIAYWDGGAWHGLQGGIAGTGARGRCLCVHDRSLFVGGLFSMAGSTPALDIAAWDGSAWRALGAGLDDEVRCLAPYGDELLAGGYFLNSGASAITRIGCWSGSSWSPLGTGTDGVVWKLAVLNGDLYAGGAFGSSGGFPASDIARWTDTSVVGRAHLVSTMGLEDYRTISAAVAAAAAAGDTVLVEAGDYPEDVAVSDKILQVLGLAGRASTSVQSFGWTSSITNPGELGSSLSGFHIQAYSHFYVPYHFNLQRCQMDGGGQLEAGPGGRFWSVSVDSCICYGDLYLQTMGTASTTTVRSSTFIGASVSEGCNGYESVTNCMLVGGGISTAASADGIDFSGNHLSGDGASIYVASLGGLGASVRDNVLSETTGGIHVQMSYHYSANVLGNQLFRCGAGIEAVGLIARVTGNHLESCAGGIAMDCDAEADALQNIVSRCGAGITARGGFPGARLEGNTISQCSGDAINCYGDTYGYSFAMSGNIIDGCGAGVRLLGTVTSSDVSCNDVIENPGGNWIGLADPTGLNGNISLDPKFCDAAGGDVRLFDVSPCAPSQQPTCGLIGALDVGCTASGTPLAPATLPDVLKVSCFPNPVRSSATIRYAVPARQGNALISVSICDVSGRLLRTLLEQPTPSGVHELAWDGRDQAGRRVPNGLCFCRVAGVGAGVSRPLVVLGAH